MANAELRMMNDKHPRCNKCNALLRFERAYGQMPDRVMCLLCGWEKMRVPETVGATGRSPVRSPVHNRELRPHAGRLGTCPVCFRENLYIRGPKCSRCYKRIRMGRDVHAA